MPRTLVTGGAGFIGSALVRALVQSGQEVANVDALTYAGNLDSLAGVLDSPLHHFFQVDLCDAQALGRVIDQFEPEVIFHLAAESHVDRSIDSPGVFIQTNVTGTFNLLQSARRFWQQDSARPFRLVHVSTDEVYGSLSGDAFFTEQSPYDPHSPYSASKAASDHLARAWHDTYGLPVVITNCSNNYGPRQFPEKLIPLTIQRAREHKSLPVYGRGENVRDWLFVEDHVSALRLVAERGRIGQTYLIGASEPRRNIDVVKLLCRLLHEEGAAAPADGFESLIEFVTDRPGHDLRYAIDATRIRTELGWQPAESFESGLRKTVRWYLDHTDWVQRVLSGEYRGDRLGLNLGMIA